MKYLLLLPLTLLLLSCEPEKEDKTGSFPTHFELSEGTETATYQEVLDFYIQLARSFPEINIQTIGETDSGRPLQMVTYNPESEFNFQKIGQNKLVFLINNGIHPGESDGIDATMLLFRDLATKKITAPENTILVTIPVYNVGGALNRNSSTRVNQNGPETYGFRGNARNYDLNRDFIKNDSKNSRTFAGIFHMANPDIFVDTHVSNGADYQYTLTHITTQHNKLGEPLGSYVNGTLLPALEDSLMATGWDLTPYVNVHQRPPDGGFSQFLDSPRYSTGYAALWNTVGIMVETHMLKPYEQRVKGTYAFLLALMNLTDAHWQEIRQLREENRKAFGLRRFYPLAWGLDSARVTQIEFKGFQADTVPSQLTGLPRLKYNREAPFTKAIPYWDSYRATDSVMIPQAYIVKKSWANVMDHLERNKIAFTTFDKDSAALVETYIIDAYQTMQAPYEGHFPHFGTQVIKVLDSLHIEAGDFLVRTDQPGIRYLMETLEPAAFDSFFNWNFFDTILQRKEGFSPYVFEEVALALLAEDASLRQAFEAKKAADEAFSKDAYAQLDWIYERSPHEEEAYLRYPVFRIPRNMP